MNTVILSGKVYPNERRGKVFPFAIKQSRKSKDGEWTHEYIDCKAFDTQYSDKASKIERFFPKGKVIHLVGSLRIEQWESRDGKKMKTPVVYVDRWEFPDKESEEEKPAALSW